MRVDRNDARAAASVTSAACETAVGHARENINRLDRARSWPDPSHPLVLTYQLDPRRQAEVCSANDTET
jgi:hypothetical protein